MCSKKFKNPFLTKSVATLPLAVLASALDIHTLVFLQCAFLQQ